MTNTNLRLAAALALALCSIPAVASADAKADAEAAAVEQVRVTQRWLSSATIPPTAEEAQHYNDGAGDADVEFGKTCLAAVEKALKAGVSPDLEVKHVLDSGSTKLIDGKAYCQTRIDYGIAFEKLVDERVHAEQAKISAKYEEYGIKGERLALFVEYDSVYFYGKGCGYYVEDIAELAKAKVLFHWLENSDGTHTIRKYQFKGDRLKKVTDKTYSKPEKAQKGCR